MIEMETKYYKVLNEGLINSGFQWKPGEWNEIPEEKINHKQDGDACGIGLHVFNERPDWGYTPYLPDHTYRVIETEGLLGKDEIKSRFRKVKLAPLPMSLSEILGDKRDGMKGSNLSQAYLSGVNLSGVDLSGANLSGANLSGTDLSRANLFDAYLSSANLSGADLTGADLTRAHGCRNFENLTKRQKKTIHC